MVDISIISKLLLLQTMLQYSYTDVILHRLVYPSDKFQVKLLGQRESLLKIVIAPKLFSMVVVTIYLSTIYESAFVSSHPHQYRILF